MGTIIICVLICAAFFAFTKVSTNKRKAERKKNFDALMPGSRVVTISGLKGVVREIDGERMVLDLSPDETGSLVKFDEEAYYQTIE